MIDHRSLPTKAGADVLNLSLALSQALSLARSLHLALDLALDLFLNLALDLVLAPVRRPAASPLDPLSDRHLFDLDYYRKFVRSHDLFALD